MGNVKSPRVWPWVIQVVHNFWFPVIFTSLDFKQNGGKRHPVNSSSAGRNGQTGSDWQGNPQNSHNQSYEQKGISN